MRIPRLVVKIAKHDSFVGELFGLVGVETFKLVGLGHVLVLAEVGLVLSRVHKFNGGMVCDRHPSNRVQMISPITATLQFKFKHVKCAIFSHHCHEGVFL